MTGAREAEVAAHAAPPGKAQQTLHGRIREDLREQIVSGRWPHEHRVPSESELMRTYGVSRITVRQALSDLESERLIFKVAGKGSFVAKPARPFQELGRLEGFAEAMGALGYETHNRVLALEQVRADAALAAKLKLGAGALVTAIERVRYLDRKPVSVDRTWVPAHLGERLARFDLTTYDVFYLLEHHCQTPLGHADLSIGAALADAKTAKLLGLTRGAPVLTIERLTYARGGEPVDYERIHCRSQDFQYRMRLYRQP